MSLLRLHPQQDDRARRRRARRRTADPHRLGHLLGDSRLGQGRPPDPRGGNRQLERPGRSRPVHEQGRDPGPRPRAPGGARPGRGWRSRAGGTPGHRPQPGNRTRRPPHPGAGGRAVLDQSRAPAGGDAAGLPDGAGGRVDRRRDGAGHGPFRGPGHGRRGLGSHRGVRRAGGVAGADGGVQARGDGHPDELEGGRGLERSRRDHGRDRRRRSGDLREAAGVGGAPPQPLGPRAGDGGPRPQSQNPSRSPTTCG